MFFMFIEWQKTDGVQNDRSVSATTIPFESGKKSRVKIKKIKKNRVTWKRHT